MVPGHDHDVRAANADNGGRGLDAYRIRPQLAEPACDDRGHTAQQFHDEPELSFRWRELELGEANLGVRTQRDASVVFERDAQTTVRSRAKPVALVDGIARTSRHFGA